METVSKNILEVKNLRVSFDTYAGEVRAVRGISFSLKQGEMIAIVGESGSGKSVSSQSIVKLLPSPPARLVDGEVRYDGNDITKYSFQKLRSIKGGEIAYIFQDPMTSLNPTLRIGVQIEEGMRAHQKLTKKEARGKAIDLLREIGIPNPEKRYSQYPHEFSGGMRQRVMIAIAIAMNPKLLIADEPTTALDVTIQAQILNTLKAINRERGMSIIMITHDMGIVANMAQRVLVMYGGKIVESASVFDIFENARHPYTRSLLAALPRIDVDTSQPLEQIVGTPPDMLEAGGGCPFAPRCRFAMKVCRENMPKAHALGEGHEAHCWLYDNRADKVRARFEAEYGAVKTAEV